jgi:predicted transcriptional regulator
VRPYVIERDAAQSVIVLRSGLVTLINAPGARLQSRRCDDGQMARKSRGALEDSVIAVLSADVPMTVAEVNAALGRELAHTTVMTALVRLVSKGVVNRVKVGRSYVYTLAAGADDLPALQAALRMRRELDIRRERADVLANFVAGLEPDDEVVLLELLAKSAAERKRLQ